VPLVDSIRVTISDQGPGLQSADIPHLFERFYRGRNQADGVGAGLGLAIAAQLVTAHGGRIWAENHGGHGASFHFSLPLATTASEQPPQKALGNL
jgi:signal transduction histidine kinase